LSFRSKAALSAAAIGLLAIPAAASAATKTVDMGVPTASQKAFQKEAPNSRAFVDVNDFFPHGTTIHTGDSIKFVPTGFHDVNFPKKGGKPLGLLAPAGTTSGVNDAAGAAFWFNGQPQLGFNPPLGPPGLFGKKATYTGAKAIESGLPLAQHPKPFTVKFPKAGTYTFYCNVHAGMKGTIRVVGKKHKVPSAKADAKTLKKQISTDLATAKTVAKTKPAANTVSVGASGKGGVEVYTMFPATQTVPVGTTVKFSMSAKSLEDHTATFGPGDPENEPTSYLGDLAGHFANDPVLPSQGVYPSDPPGTIAALSPTLHGNGFWNSGVLDTSSATPLPPSNSVTFTAPGTYNFYCLIHTNMKGTIVVQ
jgi:plastocyanin